MELTFEKVGNQYVAEFEAPSDFNLHIERNNTGVLEVHQRGSAEGAYDFAWGTGVNGRKVIDYDFGALVYPKWIKVVSGSEVISASVNFNEGGGSGSGESGDASTIEYFDIRAYDTTSMERSALICGAIYSKMKFDGKTLIAPIFQGYTPSGADMIKLLGSVEAVSIDLNIKGIFSVDKGLQTVAEFLQAEPMNMDLSSVPRISKEQFYNIEV